MSEQTDNIIETSPKRSMAKGKVSNILLCIFIPVAIVLSFIGGYFSRYLFIDDITNTTTDILSLMQRVGYIYDPNTGEEKTLTEEEIADLLVEGLLDDYAAYYTKEEYSVVKQNSMGRYSGIGITVELSGEISSVTFNSPAELVGIKKGDKAVAVELANQERVEFDSTDGGVEFRSALTSLADGKSVKLIVDRNGEEIEFTVAKSNYLASHVKYFDSQKCLEFREVDGELEPFSVGGGMAELDDSTAYVILSKFNGDADQEFEDALDYMRIRGRTKLILDLRDNGGGYTTVLKEIASCLIYNQGKSKSLISFGKGKEGSKSIYTDDNDFYDNITSISVLANENTASASECLIGAMLHYGDRFDKSKLVIEKNDKGVARTFGKGIMQTTYKLPRGDALKLTTAKIYLPDKTTSIHGVGFRPIEENAVESKDALSRAIAVLG